MGWGICFGLDDKYQIYCVDGCKWKTKESDYAHFHPWPSARRHILDYYEREAHSELDMIRDECPGTAAALKEACPEYLSAAFSSYDNLPYEERLKMHEETLNEFESEFISLKRQLIDAKDKLVIEKKRFNDFKPVKKWKTRSEKIEEDIRYLQAELPYQKALENVKCLTRARNHLSRLIRLEKQFA